jgi:hypothetical protein
MSVRPQLALSVLLAVIFTAVDVAACPCQFPVSPCEAFGKASAVFIGRLVKDAEPREAVFEVLKSFSGMADKTVRLERGFGCQITYLKGEQYLIYARRGEDKKLYVDECSRSALLSEAEEDLAFLRELPKEGAGVRLFGAVGENADWAGLTDKSIEVITSRISGVAIKVTSEDRTREFTTDSDGRFDITGLGPGDFQVEVVPPEGYTGSNLKEEFSVRDRACRYLPFVLRPDGRIGGRISGIDGKPAKVEVFLLPAEWKSRGELGKVEIGEAKSVPTDAEGRYELSGLRAGTYLLGVNVNGPSIGFPYLRLFYPGVSEFSAAAPITLGFGQKTKIDLQVGVLLKLYKVEGTVVWPDGSPALGVLVSIGGAGNIAEKTKVGTTTNDGKGTVIYNIPPPSNVTAKGTAVTEAQGRFHLTAMEGNTYYIFAMRPDEKGVVMQGRTTITLSGDVNGVTIELRPCSMCDFFGTIR